MLSLVGQEAFPPKSNFFIFFPVWFPDLGPFKTKLAGGLPENFGPKRLDFGAEAWFLGAPEHPIREQRFDMSGEFQR